VKAVEKDFDAEGKAIEGDGSACVGETDDDFAAGGAMAIVMGEFESEHIGGAGDVEIALVEIAHMGIADEGDGEFGDGGLEEFVGGAEVSAEEGQNCRWRGDGGGDVECERVSGRWPARGRLSG
jgi:hypothetical protein